MRRSTVNSRIMESSQNSIKEQAHSLQEVEWYWGDLTREEANEKMNNARNGTFLVRDALSHDSGEHTLVVRYTDANKLVKICRKNGKYGIAEPYTFDSVIELVEYHRDCSLACYNPELDVKLLYPISRFQQDDEIVDTTDVTEAIKKYVELDRNVTETIKQHQEISDDYDRTVCEIQLKQQGVEAFSAMIKMFEGQKKLQEQCRLETQPHEIAKFSENVKLLKQRLMSLEQSKLQLIEKLKGEISLNRNLERRMNTLKSDILQLTCIKEKYSSWLNKNGVDQRKIHQLSCQFETRELDLDVYQKESTWLCLKSSRSDADRILTSKPDGTFLIRRSTLGQYALSIACNNTVNHCRIFAMESGFGFTESYCIHPTLSHLVFHYARHSLEEHNKSLTTTLAFPAFASADTLIRLQVQQQLRIQQMNSASQLFRNRACTR